MTVTDPKWIYNFNELTQAPEEYTGFVYEITNIPFDKKYIGQKLFWKVKKLPPLKGKTRKRTKTVESDWQDYWGSSNKLLEDIALQGTQDFKREILVMCRNKTEMNYNEAALQFNRDVLLRDDYYNGIINCRITSRGLT